MNKKNWNEQYHGKLMGSFPIFDCPLCKTLHQLSCLVERADGSRFADYQCASGRILSIPLDAADVLMLNEPFYFDEKGRIAMR